MQNLAMSCRVFVCFCAFALSTDAAIAAEWSGKLKLFFKVHCYDCHDAKSKSGGLNIPDLSTGLNDSENIRRWTLIHDRIVTGEMPPKDANAPSAADRNTAVKSLNELLTEADRANRQVVLRRLNRNEYENTVRDLFDIHVDLKRILIDDSSENQFDTIASTLSLSAQQIATYVDSADIVLDQVFGPSKEPKHIRKTGNFKDVRSVGSSDRITPDGIVLFNSRSLPMYGVSTSEPGRYRFRFDVKAVQTNSPVIVQVNGGVTGRIAPHVIDFFEVQPGKVSTIELTDRAIELYDTFSISLVHGYPWYKVDSDKYKGPGVFLGNFEIEGPLDKWPPPSARKLLGDVDPKKGTLRDIRAILLRILPRAFRRSTKEAEVELYVELAKKALDEGLSFEKALRRGLKGVICAPEFLFMEESYEQSTRVIDDFALASRLSYFLWSSMPDDELFALAERNELRKPKALSDQVERMLRDPKSRQFIENFTGQWLRLRDIDFTVPDKLIYPEYNQLLRRSMINETREFIIELIKENLSVQNVIDSEFVMINEPLANFYGIGGVKGLKIRRVELPDDSVRGGVMTQASVLKVSADGTSTSPVLRGVWVLKNLYGTPPQPPPASVEAIEPDIRGATTIREQLAKHRAHTSCNSCHQYIDPPGFALESFDVIGGWRTWYRTRQQGKRVELLVHPQNSKQFVRYRQGLDVDPTGVLSDGQKFDGIREYKQLLIKDETAMARSLARLLLTYSHGRTLGFSDRLEVEKIVTKARAKNYGLRTLLLEVVQSDTFRKR